MLTKFLNPKNDIAFKKIFGTEKNKDIIIQFLNDVLVFKSKRPIVDIQFLKPIQDPETAAKKTSIVDILCKDQDGNQYIVEMQVASEKGFVKRAQYYASKAYIAQMKARGKYFTLKEVIFLAISNFTMFPEKKAYKSDHVILDRETLENDLKDFSFTFLELPKFKKDLEHLQGDVDKWCYFFKHAEDVKEEDLHKLTANSPIMGRVFDELDRFGWSDEDLLAYEESEKREADFIAAMDQKFDEGAAEGEKKGIVKGEKIGIEKGEKIGIKKGEALAEKRTTLTIAKNCIKNNMEVEMIQSITGLSKDEIEKLSEQLRKPKKSRK